QAAGARTVLAGEQGLVDGDAADRVRQEVGQVRRAADAVAHRQVHAVQLDRVHVGLEPANDHIRAVAGDGVPLKGDAGRAAQGLGEGGAGEVAEVVGGDDVGAVLGGALQVQRVRPGAARAVDDHVVDARAVG